MATTLAITNIGSKYKVVINSSIQPIYTSSPMKLTYNTVNNTVDVCFVTEDNSPCYYTAIPIANLSLGGVVITNQTVFETQVASVFLNAGSSAIPTRADSLVLLTGEIIFTSGNYYFVDRSGNARNFLITGYDFDANWITGFPYKSAATISAPAGDATLIAADLNSFLYTAGTPNQIPVVSLFQDIDYEHKMFSLHQAAQLNSNGVEILEARVMNFVVYNSVRTGSNLISCQNYFKVPVEITSNVIWVSKAGNNTTGNGSKANPWLTMMKANDSGTAGYTVYVKSGSYAEIRGGFIYMWCDKSMNYKGIGLVKHTNPVRTASAGTYSFDRMIVDVANGTSECFFSAAGVKNTTLTNCYLTRSTQGYLALNNTDDNVSITNCVMVGSLVSIYATQRAGIKGAFVSGCYFKNIQFSPSSDLVYKNNKWYENDKTSCIYTNGFGIDAYGNTFNTKLSAIVQQATFSVAKTVSIHHNNFLHQANTTSGSSMVEFTGTVNFYANNNIFKSYLTTLSSLSLMIKSYVNTGYINEIDYNTFITKASTVFYHIDTTGIGTKIRNNFSWSDSLTGVQISLGGESTASGTNNNSIVINNRIIGAKLDDPNAVVSGIHCLFVGGGVDIKVSNNYISDTLLAIVVKTGNLAQSYTTEGVYSNLIRNCGVGVWCRGVAGISIFNNTFSGTFSNVIIADENATIGGIQNSSNVIAKNNIFDLPIGVGNIIYFDSYASVNGCIAEKSVINGGLTIWNDGTTSYSDLALAQLAGKMIGCISQNPNLLNMIPITPIAIGENFGAPYQIGLDVSTLWGSENINPSIVTKSQVASGLWQVGAYVQ